MGLFSGFFDLFSDNNIPDYATCFDSTSEINPASGLPMIGGIGGLDVEGNPYGIDHDDSTDTLAMNDDFGMDAMDSSNSFDSFDNDDIYV